MIAILTTDPSLFESLRAGLNLSSSGPDGVARGHGFTLTCRSDGDVRGLLDEAVESS
ncbi:MAG TPA: hypothetical protein PK765_04005 [bacterium]|nr:hypothetical protein [bacterium]